MSFPVFASGDVLNASDMNGVGLWLVKSQTVGTGVSSVTVTNAFSADYDSYRIVYTGFTGSASGGVLYMRCVTSGGSDNASNWKGNTFFVFTGATGGLNNANTTSGANSEIAGIGPKVSSAVFEVTGPFLAQNTQVSFSSAEDVYWRTGASILDNNTSYTGMKILPATGTLTGGTIRVYGYRN